ncbi:MAG: 30S ribosomal protein S8 [Candidatus Berkelbacteria bacterium]|nr:30S ribosomal protein S8 [Candidatus Berkelbacteria bacterium]
MNIDSISNLIVIIQNGYKAGKSRVYLPYSKEKERILDVLKKENYIKNVRILDKDGKKMLAVRLLYQNDSPAVNYIKRISKPGQRIYAKPSEFKAVLPFSKSKKDYGSTIISTSQGIMTTEEAKKKNIGGELLLKVY